MAGRPLTGASRSGTVSAVMRYMGDFSSLVSDQQKRLDALYQQVAQVGGPGHQAAVAGPAMAELRRLGETLDDIAAKTGVRRSTVHRWSEPHMTA